MPIILLVLWLALDGTLMIVRWEWQHGLPQPKPSWTSNLSLVLALLIYGQFIITTGWITVGEQGIKTTITAVLAAVLATVLAPRIFGVIGWRGALQSTFIATLFSSIYAVILNLPLVIARIRGWRFCFDSKPQADTIPAYQISIREMLVFTTLVAVVAAVWAGTNQPPRIANSVNSSLHPVAWDVAFIISMFVAISVPWSIWAIFCWVRPFYAGLVAIIVACLWGVVFVRMLGTFARAGTDAEVFLLILALISPGVMIAHLLLLQIVGFRWKRKPDENSVITDKGPDWQNDELWRRYGRPGS